ncbi:MAG: hypothetical protein OCD76_21340 [Reichenbachiella sp.]
MRYLIPLLCVIIIGCKPQTQTTSEKPVPFDIQRKIAFCPPVLDDNEWYNSDNKAPLLDGLDVLDFPVTTVNPLAQEYFNQGLILAFAFNHAEAARSFYYASQLDSTCAMAYWGYAYVLGPNFNAGMNPNNYKSAYKAIQKAMELVTDQTSVKEKILIDALSKRYIKEATADRNALDIAYSESMKEATIQHPYDAHIGALYAESLMDLHPWDIWDQDGQPKEWTTEILAAFDQVFELDSVHPGAHHLYIHAVEASATPELGLTSAQLYDEGLVPGAGHLVHMPAHIYIRTGDYHKGTLSNLRSVKVDSSYLSNCYAQGTYPLTLYPHNYHFMSATATLEGDSELAIFAAQKVADHANRQLMKEPGWGTIQHYYTIPYYIHIKFAKWNEILEMENEDPSILYPEAVRHYARGMAFLGLRDPDSAKVELAFLQEFAQEEEFKNVTIWGANSTYDLLQIASRVLEAEILTSLNQLDESILLLQQAIAIEDALTYQEPSDWFFSVRHHLGNVLLQANRNEEAIQIYQQDLSESPKNGWALHGLKAAYANLSDIENEQLITQQLETVWAYADVELEGSVVK